MELVNLQIKNVFRHCLLIQVVVYAVEENLEYGHHKENNKTWKFKNLKSITVDVKDPSPSSGSFEA